ncbi:hypothetical protein ACA910_005455 [Epithemia clementina (nom. ined.)]
MSDSDFGFSSNGSNGSHNDSSEAEELPDEEECSAKNSSKLEQQLPDKMKDQSASIVKMKDWSASIAQGGTRSNNPTMKNQQQSFYWARRHQNKQSNKKIATIEFSTQEFQAKSLDDIDNEANNNPGSGEAKTNEQAKTNEEDDLSPCGISR